MKETIGASRLCRQPAALRVARALAPVGYVALGAPFEDGHGSNVGRVRLRLGVQSRARRMRGNVSQQPRVGPVTRVTHARAFSLIHCSMAFLPRAPMSRRSAPVRENVCVCVCGRDYVKYGFCVCAGKRKLLYTKLVRLSNFKIIVYGCGSPTVSENQGNSS